MAGSRGGIVQDTLAPTEMPNTVAAPVDTYTQVTKAQTPGALFLEGLGKLAKPATDAMVNFDQQAGDTAEADANLKALTASPEELRQEIASGNYYGMAHRRAQSALRVMDAQNQVFSASSKLDDMNQRGELAGPDAQQKLAAIVGAHATLVQGDPLAEKQFTAGMMPVMRTFTTDILRNNIQTDETNKAAKLYSHMIGLHDQVDREALDNPTDPDTLAGWHKTAMFRAADFAKNDLLMSPKAIQDVMGKVADHYANAGNTAALDAIGKYDRNGSPLSDQYGPQWDAWKKKAEAVTDAAKKRSANSDADGLEAQARKGEMLPDDFNKAVDFAAAKDPENFGPSKAERLKALYQQVATQKRDAAIKVMSEQQEAQVKRDYTEKSASALGDGNGYTIPEVMKFTTPDGVEHTIKREDAVSDGYKRKEAMLDEQASKENWSPEDLLRAKTKLYSQNGDVHPLFQQSFNDLFSSSRAGIPANPDTLPQRLSQLEFLRTNDPNQFANLSGRGKDGKQQETWLTAYDAARDNGIEPERAFAIANQRVFNPGAIDRTVSNADMQSKVDDVLKKWTATGWFGTSLGGGPGVVSSPIARKLASDAVQLQIAAGTSDKDIVEKASAGLTRNRIIVNGMPVHSNLPGVGDPSVAAEYLSDAAAYYKKITPGLRDQPFDIAIGDDPIKPGSYTVYRMDTGERVTRQGVPNSSISGSSLISFVMQMRERERTEKKTAADNFEKLKNTAPTSMPEPTDEELKALGKERRAKVGGVIKRIVGRGNETPAEPTVNDLRGD